MLYRRLAIVIGEHLEGPNGDNWLNIIGFSPAKAPHSHHISYQQPITDIQLQINLLACHRLDCPEFHEVNIRKIGKFEPGLIPHPVATRTNNA